MSATSHCCGRKAWVASVQSFALWQQATTEITRSLLSPPLASAIKCSLASQTLFEVTHQDHSIKITLLLLVHITYICVLFFPHPVRGELHIQHNANREVATPLWALSCL